MSLISFPRHLRVGAGAIDQIAEVLADLELNRPLLVTDSFLTATGAAERILGLLHQAGMSAALFDRTVPDDRFSSRKGRGHQNLLGRSD